MTKRFIYILFLLNLGVQIAYAQKFIGDNSSGTFFYDENAEHFLNVPKTKQTVDSLLALTQDVKNKNFSKALSTAQLSLNISESIAYQAGIGRAHNLLGVTYMRLGSHEEALRHYLAALEVETKRGDKERKGLILNGIATLYGHQENYEKSAEYFRKVMEQAEEIGDKTMQVTSTMNLGVVNYYQKKYEESLRHYQQALTLLENSEDIDEAQVTKMMIYSNFGISYVELGELEKAERYLTKSTAFFNENGQVRVQSENYYYLAKLSEKRGELNKALEYAKESLERAKRIGFKLYLIQGYDYLTKLYVQKDDYRHAYTHLQQFKAVQDSVLNSERGDKIREMQTRFDVKQKNREIELLNKETALNEAQLGRQKLWRIFMIIGLVLSMAIVALLYRYNNQKKRANYLLEQKNAQIEQKNMQLVGLNQEKDEFLGMAAHDLRNPLTGIASVVGLLKDQDQLSDDEFDEYVNMIGDSSDRMLNIINNLLDVNAIEEGGRELELSAVYLKDVIEKTVNAEQRHAFDKNINIKTNFDTNLKPVKADQEALQRVLENLVSNAVKYSPSGSSVKVLAQMGQDFATVYVVDNGPGIPEEEHDQLFKRFSRISTTPTGDESSTGLGLFIVKKLVEKMNGMVRCDSQPNEGTKFILTLPLAVRQEQMA